MPSVPYDLSHKRIFITGGAGSIGTQLVYQLLQLGVKELLIFDNAETELYFLKRELEQKCSVNSIKFCLGDISNVFFLDQIFAEFNPDIVIHTAAYKHVSMVEENPCTGARINILGTDNVIHAAVKNSCEAVFFISTDKAVNPSSFMGMTKRISELYCRYLNAKGKSEVQFKVVRFGNVIGSKGSLVPLVKKQLGDNSPITITDPNAKRYFIEPLEMAKLTLSLMEVSLDYKETVFLYEMGQPISIREIVDLVLKQEGKLDGSKIEFKEIGLQKGEKLAEELQFEGSELVKTIHPKIFACKEKDFDGESFYKDYQKLIELILKNEEITLVDVTKSMVNKFS